MFSKKASDFMTNKVLECFTRIGDSRKYKCGIENCNKELLGIHKSNLVAHVRRCHLQFFEDRFKVAQVPEVIPLPIKRLNYIQKCAEIVAVNGHAFTILDESGIRQLLRHDYEALKLGGFASGLSRPNFPAVKKHIRYLSHRIVEKIRVETRGASISVMADSATKHRRSILGLSIQYMHEGKIKIRTIGMVDMTVSHTAENLMNAIVNRLKFYEIEMHQVLSITTDNASNMSAMVNLMNANESNANRERVEERIETPDDDDDDNEEDGSDSDWSDEDETDDPYEIPKAFFDMATDYPHEDDNGCLEFDAADDNSEADSEENERLNDANELLNETDDLNRLLKELEKRFSVHTLNINGIRCAVHTLQLAIRDALKETELNKLINKCREICRLLKKSKVKKLLRRNNISITVPKLDCKTRWNSTYSMLKDLLRCLEAVNFLAPTYTSCASILQSWKIIEEMVEILHVPFEITTTLETSTLTLSDLFGILLKMEYKMEKFASNANRHTKLADSLLKNVSDRKAKLIISPALLCSVFLDPRYCYDLSAAENKIAKLTLDKFYTKWVQRSKNAQEDTNDSNADDSFEKYRAAKRARLVDTTRDENRPSDELNIVLLLENYEKNLPEMRVRDSILTYWLSRKESDPILYQLASMVNTIPPTQVTVERAFSILGLIYNARRTRLSPEMLQHILLIKLNKDLVPEINAEDVAKLKDTASDAGQ